MQIRRNMQIMIIFQLKLFSEIETVMIVNAIHIFI